MNGRAPLVSRRSSAPSRPARQTPRSVLLLLGALLLASGAAQAQSIQAPAPPPSPPLQLTTGYVNAGSAQSAVDSQSRAALTGKTLRCAEYNILRDGVFTGDGCAPVRAQIMIGCAHSRRR